MQEPTWHDFIRYLTAKRTVDDRALNCSVWERFAAAVCSEQETGGDRLNVLEVGAGIGTMIERCVERDLFTNCSYHAIDSDGDNVVEAGVRLQDVLQIQGYATHRHETDEQNLGQGRSGFFLDCNRSRGDGSFDALEISYEQADLFEFASRPDQRQRYDLLIAHAFLDLVDVPRALALFAHLLRPGALLYLTIIFDGSTILQPTIDHHFDTEIERLYHSTMDRRIVNGQRSGDSLSGRHMFAHLRAAQMNILAAGSSDWVVFAGPEGYPADEAYFLHFIVETIFGALADHPQMDREQLRRWIAVRHSQIDTGDLVYIAHQLDFLAQCPVRN